MAERTSRALEWVVRTPHGRIFEARVSSVRVRAATGHVGLRPGSEPCLLAIEPGLILVHLAEQPTVVSVLSAQGQKRPGTVPVVGPDTGAAPPTVAGGKLAGPSAAGASVFIASVGGLVRCTRERAQLLTPLAVVGSDRAEVSAQLEEALAMPGADLELRHLLIRLETGILAEMRDGRTPPPGPG